MRSEIRHQYCHIFFGLDDALNDVNERTSIRLTSAVGTSRHRHLIDHLASAQQERSERVVDDLSDERHHMPQRR
jgi:hypothetical protein